MNKPRRLPLLLDEVRSCTICAAHLRHGPGPAQRSFPLRHTDKQVARQQLLDIGMPTLICQRGHGRRVWTSSTGSFIEAACGESASVAPPASSRPHDSARESAAAT